MVDDDPKRVTIPADGKEAGIELEAHVSGYQITTHHLTDRELDNALRRDLKRYLEERINAVKITNVDFDKQTKTENVQALNLISEPEFASAAAAWVSLRSHEEQANLNLKLQRLILLVAIGTLVSSFLSVLLAYLHLN